MTRATVPLVFIVDDDPSVRKSLVRLIRSAGYEVEAFASAEDFLSREPSIGPCCVVLDVRMPGVTGLDLQKTLKSALHGIPIVFITGYGDVSMSVSAMKAGAIDFLTKPFEGKDLLSAVQRVVQPRQHVGGDLGAEARTGEVQKRAKLLTPRQRQVFALVVTGMLNKQIASELRIAEKTVKVHRAQVMEKMRAGSVAELVRLADEIGVIVTQA